MSVTKITGKTGVSAGRAAGGGAGTFVPTTRPDLTDYRVYIDVLLDRLNDGSVYKMGIEDLLKLHIEKAMSNYCPDVVIVPSRKRYVKLPF